MCEAATVFPFRPRWPRLPGEKTTRPTPSSALLLAAGVVALASFAPASQGQIVATDSYVIGADPAAGQYVDGTALKNQPAALTNVGFVNGGYVSGTSQFSATAGGLASTLPGTTGGKVNYGAAPLDANIRSNARNLSPAVPASGTYWISHTVNRGDIPQAGGTGYVLTGFGNTVAPTAGTTTGNLAGLFVGFAQSPNKPADFGDVVIRYRDAASATSADAVVVDGSAASTFGTSYTVLMKLDVNVGGGSADNVAWWLNPTDFTDEATLGSSSAASGNFSSFALAGPADFARLNYSAFQWNGNAFFDEPRLSTTLAGIAVPEPTSLALLGLGGLTLLRRRRA